MLIGAFAASSILQISIHVNHRLNAEVIIGVLISIIGLFSFLSSHLTLRIVAEIAVDLQDMLISAGIFVFSLWTGDKDMFAVLQVCHLLCFSQHYLPGFTALAIQVIASTRPQAVFSAVLSLVGLILAVCLIDEQKVKITRVKRDKIAQEIRRGSFAELH